MNKMARLYIATTIFLLTACNEYSSKPNKVYIQHFASKIVDNNNKIKLYNDIKSMTKF